MRDFTFSAKAKDTASVEEILGDTYSANAIKLVSLLADALGVIAPIYKETRKNKDGNDFTIYRLSNEGAMNIVAAFKAKGL
jgi:hypothetical protein